MTPKQIGTGVKAPGTKAKSSAAAPKQQAQAGYILSEPAAVTFAAERKLRGQKAGGKCRKLKQNAKPSGPFCTLWVKTGRTLQQAGAAGPNVQLFSAKSFRGKGLKPGAYRVSAVARDAAGNASASSFARFGVVQPR